MGGCNTFFPQSKYFCTFSLTPSYFWNKHACRQQATLFMLLREISKNHVLKASETCKCIDQCIWFEYALWIWMFFIWMLSVYLLRPDLWWCTHWDVCKCAIIFFLFAFTPISMAIPWVWFLNTMHPNLAPYLQSSSMWLHFNGQAARPAMAVQEGGRGSVVSVLMQIFP